MSQSGAGGWDGRPIGDVERLVQTELADMARNGPVFVKSPRVADELDIDVSNHRVGQAIAKLDAETSVLSIDRWSGDSADQVTWHVTLEGPSPYGAECPDCGTLVDEPADDCPHCGQGPIHERRPRPSR